MTVTVDTFGPADDALHPPSPDFYENETYWFSFFVPERALGAWLYTGVRQNAGVSTGGMFVWDSTGTTPWQAPHFEYFSWLKAPSVSAERAQFPNGITVTTVEPGMVYDLSYDDRAGTTASLRFEGLEAPVPLLAGAPPYPHASHYDQTGHVTGTLVLEGERLEVDCFAMRDRSWGPRRERGYGRVGYTWLADADVSLLTFSRPGDGEDEIYAGYVRRDDEVTRISSGRRRVARDPDQGWVTSMQIEAVDEDGVTVSATAVALSRLVLPGATNLCLNTALRCEVDGREVHGEDQDVWSFKAWRAHTRSSNQRSAR